MQSPLKVRSDATAFIRERGIHLGTNRLAALASEGRGPRYSIVNGRALYREGDLIAWIDEQMRDARRISRLAATGIA